MSRGTNSDPYIAGRRTVADWQAFKPSLLAGQGARWPDAFQDYFKARLESRYLAPIKLLQDHGTFQGEGFSIVAIQCTLIEFLAATLRGMSYRFVSQASPRLGAYEYSKSGKMFNDFLVTEQPFAAVFTQAVAEDFYASVRCGLLHEARTKNGWTIWAKGNAMIDPVRKIVFRDNLQTAILDYVSQYGRTLLGDPALQAAFIRKFDDLAL
ncbi:hypothetical protein [Mesorhizobium sp. BH1-1-4]|uniref:hypothetical protein n=1 Tax=Mesorhizobium sp. BH1-1-4 TaxID=2876662 RepID=UPI001CD0C043|nr:hypothetical protein [Mesorhizobium sp. BH1-1-4]MBZ9992978.1 hypothetical protein [Mesorhizobium sp. BH1-1-4]